MSNIVKDFKEYQEKSAIVLKSKAPDITKKPQEWEAWFDERTELAKQLYALGQQLEKENHSAEAVRAYWLSFELNGNSEAENRLFSGPVAQKPEAEVSNSNQSPINNKATSPEDLFYNGLYYISGIGVGYDYQKALDCFKKSAPKNINAFYCQGLLLSFTKDKQADGINYLQQAASKNSSHAQSKLGYLGFKSAQNTNHPYADHYQKRFQEIHARELLTKATKQGDIRAMKYLGALTKSKFYLEKSAQHGDQEAKFYLADLFLKENKLDSRLKAMNYFRELALQNIEAAQQKLTICYFKPPEGLPIAAEQSWLYRQDFEMGVQNDLRDLKRLALEKLKECADTGDGLSRYNYFMATNETDKKSFTEPMLQEIFNSILENQRLTVEQLKLELRKFANLLASIDSENVNVNKLLCKFAGNIFAIGGDDNLDCAIYFLQKVPDDSKEIVKANLLLHEIYSAKNQPDEVFLSARKTLEKAVQPNIEQLEVIDIDQLEVIAGMYTDEKIFDELKREVDAIDISLLTFKENEDLMRIKQLANVIKSKVDLTWSQKSLELIDSLEGVKGELVAFKNEQANKNIPSYKKPTFLFADDEQDLKKLHLIDAFDKILNSAQAKVVREENDSNNNNSVPEGELKHKLTS